jgi:hypothetical protein
MPLMHRACALWITGTQLPPSQSCLPQLFEYPHGPLEPPSSAQGDPLVGCADGHPRASTPPAGGQSETVRHVPSRHAVLRDTTRPSLHVTL